MGQTFVRWGEPMRSVRTCVLHREPSTRRPRPRAFPLAGPLKGFVQFFTGYGETLLDYNERDERIGIGLLLADWV